MYVYQNSGTIGKSSINVFDKDEADVTAVLHDEQSSSASLPQWMDNHLFQYLLHTTYIRIQNLLQVWNHHVSDRPELAELRLPRQAHNCTPSKASYLKQCWQVHNSLHVLMQASRQGCNVLWYQRWEACQAETPGRSYDDDDVSFYNSIASTWTLATPRTTWETYVSKNSEFR